MGTHITCTQFYLKKKKKHFLPSETNPSTCFLDSFPCCFLSNLDLSVICYCWVLWHPPVVPVTQDHLIPDVQGQPGQQSETLSQINSAGCQWLTPIILTTEEAEIRRIDVQSQPGQIVLETLSRKNPSQKRSGSRCRL
jgi:hypothetical protein